MSHCKATCAQCETDTKFQTLETGIEDLKLKIFMKSVAQV